MTMVTLKKDSLNSRPNFEKGALLCHNKHDVYASMNLIVCNRPNIKHYEFEIGFLKKYDRPENPQI